MNGVVVLPPGTTFPDGTEVKVELLPVTTADDPFITAVEQILRHGSDMGSTPGTMPDDMAANHDYYLHGHSRKQQPRTARWIDASENAPELTEQQVNSDVNQLLSLAAETTGLPSDLSTNHDHYLHGLPKK
jgi:hypothetical protein